MTTKAKRKTTRVHGVRARELESPAPIVLGEPEPSKLQKRVALLAVLFIVLVAGIAGAAIELVLKPLLEQPTTPAVPPQDISMRVVGHEYVPSVIQIQAGVPVRWTIDSSEAVGCTKSLVVPDLGIQTIFTQDSTTIEFTPKEKGKIPFSCAMAMAQGYFEVV